jgi:hypothetical protein
VRADVGFVVHNFDRHSSKYILDFQSGRPWPFLHILRRLGSSSFLDYLLLTHDEFLQIIIVSVIDNTRAAIFYNIILSVIHFFA